jgi:xanthine dehydrogenase YagR molybdenum-binding subunit
MPINADVPEIKTIVVPNDDRNSNPLGAKGIGELSMVGVAAAIAERRVSLNRCACAKGTDQD